MAFCCPAFLSVPGGGLRCFSSLCSPRGPTPWHRSHCDSHNGYKSHLWPKADGDVGGSEARALRSHVDNRTPMQRCYTQCRLLYSTRQAAKSMGHGKTRRLLYREGGNDLGQTPV